MNIFESVAEVSDSLGVGPSPTAKKIVRALYGTWMAGELVEGFTCERLRRITGCDLADVKKTCQELYEDEFIVRSQSSLWVAEQFKLEREYATWLVANFDQAWEKLFSGYGNLHNARRYQALTYIRDSPGTGLQPLQNHWNMSADEAKAIVLSLIERGSIVEFNGKHYAVFDPEMARNA